MSSDDIGSKSTRALFWGASGAIGKIASQLAIQITLARILGPETFGQFAVLLSVLSLGGVLAECGFGAALIQRKNINHSDISLALGWTIATATLIALVICLLAPSLARQFGDESLYRMLMVSAFLIVPQAMGNLSTNLLQRDLNMKSIQIIHLFTYAVCFGGVATTLAMLGWQGWSLVIAYGAQTIFKSILTYTICRHTLRPRLNGDWTLIQFGLKSLANDLLTWSMDNFDRFIIGRFWGLYSLGLYSVAFNLAKAPSGLLTHAVQGIAFSSTARLQNDLPAVKKGFQIVISGLALISIPLFSMVAYESETVLRIVYGLKWIKGAPYMTALALTIPIISLGSITSSMLRGIGAIGIEIRIQAITAIVFFGGLFILKSIPLEQAVWIVPAVYLLRFALLIKVIRTQLKMSIKGILSLFRGAVVLTTTGLCTLILMHQLPGVLTFCMGVLPLVAGCAVCLTLFLIYFPWFLGPPLTALLKTRFRDSYVGLLIARLDRTAF